MPWLRPMSTFHCISSTELTKGIQDCMTDEKIHHKEYHTHSNRVLNRAIKIRMKQIKNHQDGKSTTDKTLLQLIYERDAMMNTLLERSITKNSDPKSS